ncbi:VOC family protein [Xanthobacter sp. DSM 24535]|uniref:VOC family protein n=1 Tax=Roseixanthobacter psychrophilus TaxID=3119917 RepID=UPI0037288598
MLPDSLASTILTMRPFLPAKDFAVSLGFYEALGFEATPLGEKMAHMQLGRFAFLLQEFYVKEFAENLMMHVLVEDLDAWWRHIEALSLAERFDVGPPRPPKLESWGLRVSYVFDPAGVLWHFAEEPKA